jgi:outer membrane protein insertion porin family
VFGYRLQGSFITGYAGKSAPPYERFYSGGENDLRGFDIRSVTPYAYVSNQVQVSLTNPDNSFVPFNPANPRQGDPCNLSQGTSAVAPGYKCRNITVPVNTLTFTGGDTNIVSNMEYRIPIVGPVTFALFNDFGLNFNALPNQLQLSDVNLNQLNSTPFGCPTFALGGTCTGGVPVTFSKNLKLVPGTNFVPRMSTGAELQVILPIVNAPFRLYYAYNPLILDTKALGINQMTRDMFPAGGAGDYTFRVAQSLFGTQYLLREPRKTFRFTVSTTF